VKGEHFSKSGTAQGEIPPFTALRAEQSELPSFEAGTPSFDRVPDVIEQSQSKSSVRQLGTDDAYSHQASPQSCDLPYLTGAGDGFQGKQYSGGHGVHMEKGSLTFGFPMRCVIRSRRSRVRSSNFRARRRSNRTMRILRGLSSRRLPCGCVAGIYETYSAEVVTVIDAREETCRHESHLRGEQIRLEPDEPALQSEGGDGSS
jgi:hypothetical protein